jgi:hypothetical protein
MAINGVADLNSNILQRNCITDQQVAKDPDANRDKAVPTDKSAGNEGMDGTQICIVE